MNTTQVIPFNVTYSKTAVFPRSTPITIRKARPADAELIVQMHERLSATSLDQRYNGGRVPCLAKFQQMCDANCFVALQNGQVVGMAYFVVNKALPIVAEVALLVEDAAQGQGIGRQLMNKLVQEAKQQNIRFFDGYIQSSNRAMIHLLHSSGKLVENHYDYGCVEMRVELGAAQPAYH